jgi:hypothetical protein
MSIIIINSTNFASTPASAVSGRKELPANFTDSFKVIAAFIGLAFVGTGGVVPPDNVQTRISFPTGARPEFARIESLSRRDGNTPSKMIYAIKSAFGMNMTQVAQAMQVERQTIYQWLDEEQPVGMQSRNKERLLALYNFAQQWNQLSKLPTSKSIDTFEFEGQTLLDLLSNEHLDDSKVADCMQALATQINNSQATKKSLSVAEKLKAKGFLPPPGSEITQNVKSKSGVVSGLFES